MSPTAAPTSARAATAAPVRRRASGRATVAPQAAPRRTGAGGHLRVVRPRPRPVRRLRLLLAVGLLIVVGSVFGLVAFNVFLVQSQFTLERLQGQVERQHAQYQQLRLEAARLSAPDRILQIARQRLGMVEPAKVTAVSVPADALGPNGAASPEGARAWAEVKPYLAAEP